MVVLITCTTASTVFSAARLKSTALLELSEVYFMGVKSMACKALVTAL